MILSYSWISLKYISYIYIYIFNTYITLSLFNIPTCHVDKLDKSELVKVVHKIYDSTKFASNTHHILFTFASFYTAAKTWHTLQVQLYKQTLKLRKHPRCRITAQCLQYVQYLHEVFLNNFSKVILGRPRCLKIFFRGCFIVPKGRLKGLGVKNKLSHESLIFSISSPAVTDRSSVTQMQSKERKKNKTADDSFFELKA